MKKVLSAIIACVFVLAMSTVAFAAVSPIAPTISETTTIAPPTSETTTVDSEPTDKPSEKPTEKPTEETTTQKPDVDETTTVVDETTTKQPVASDTNPSSPDTGAYVGKTVSAAAFVALALGGAVIYTSKKKAE